MFDARIPLLSLALAGGLTAAAEAADIVGPAQVIDANTVTIGSDVIRLADIDAPDLGQACERAARRYDCGQEAAWALAQRVERHWLTCHGRERDESGRVPAICFLAGPAIDINGHMVRQGWALAVGERYAAEQAAAQRERRGLWAGRFAAPAEWRTRLRP
jgi:endonuclease YncB( thermonuclease family)